MHVAGVVGALRTRSAAHTHLDRRGGRGLAGPAEIEADAAAQPRGGEAAEAALGPGADRARREGDARLESRDEQDCPDADQQDGGGGSEQARVEAECEADRCDEDSDRREGQRQASAQRQRAELMLRRRRSEHDRKQRQDAGR